MSCLMLFAVNKIFSTNTLEKRTILKIRKFHDNNNGVGTPSMFDIVADEASGPRSTLSDPNSLGPVPSHYGDGVSGGPRPRECVHPDIVSSNPLWDRQYPWFFSHIMKTMGTTVYAELRQQLPDGQQFERKFRGVGNITYYEQLNGVDLRTRPDFPDSKFTKESVVNVDHLPVDDLLDLGILRCSDVERMEVMAIVREPLGWAVSHCNQFGRDMEWEIACLSGNESCPWFSWSDAMKQSTQLRFEYKWDFVVVTMERTELISEWFARFGLDVRFDIFSNQRAEHEKKCRMEDVTEEQRQQLRELLADDITVYEAAKWNNDVLRIDHHFRLPDPILTVE